MKKFSLWELLFTLFIMFLVISFIVVPQALSRSPDNITAATSPILKLNIEPLATIQSIENQFIYTETEHRQEIIPLVESPGSALISANQEDIAKPIIRPILLL